MNRRGAIRTFTVDLPHLRSEYEVLEKLGTYTKVAEGVYRWTFVLDDIEKVQVALGGDIIEFEKDDIVRGIIPHCEPLMRALDVELHKKGKGTITVVVIEGGYQVTYYQGGAEKSFTVARSLVEKIWFEVMAKYEKDAPQEAKKVAEDIVQALQKHHWQHDEPLFLDDKDNEEYPEVVKRWEYAKTGNFNWKYFFGDRRNYHKLYYAPMKAMVGLGLASHSKDGKIVRLADVDEFDSQRKFKEIELCQKQVEREQDAEVRTMSRSDRRDILKWAEQMK
jgi:hypothetical protein